MQKTFRIAINMAGAVSAGAYTAGVFDFLVEALDQWQVARREKRPVLGHEVVVEVLSGASAGGMCAALGAFSLFDAQHPAQSRLHRAWVEEIDILGLLGSRDLAGGAPVLSLLDSTALDAIADRNLSLPGVAGRPLYVSEDLAVILTLTNLRGIPYSVDFANAGFFEERASLHADHIEFKITGRGRRRTREKSDSHVIRLDKPDQDEVRLLREAALATGAFPGALAARTVVRGKDEYMAGAPPGMVPAWDDAAVPALLPMVNIDGGATNNSPFQLALDHLARAGSSRNGRGMSGDSRTVDHAVLTIAPFPGNETFNLNYDPASERTLEKVILRMARAMLDQARFYGEELSLFRGRKVFDRFVIAPNDEMALPGALALQCGSFGHFGGFLERSFRERDYELGRRNCQRFLREHFVLPAENRVIRAGMAGNAARLTGAFHATDRSVKRPPGVSTVAWMPVIPLCGSASTEVPYPARGKITEEEIDRIARAATRRLLALTKSVARGRKAFARIAAFEARMAVRLAARASVRKAMLRVFRAQGDLGTLDESGRGTRANP